MSNQLGTMFMAGKGEGSAFGELGFPGHPLRGEVGRGPGEAPAHVHGTESLFFPAFQREGENDGGFPMKLGVKGLHRSAIDGAPGLDGGLQPGPPDAVGGDGLGDLVGLGHSGEKRPRRRKRMHEAFQSHPWYRPRPPKLECDAAGRQPPVARKRPLVPGNGTRAATAPSPRAVAWGSTLRVRAARRWYRSPGAPRTGASWRCRAGAPVPSGRRRRAPRDRG